MKTIEIFADTRGVARCTGATCGKKLLWATVVKSGRKMCFDFDAAVPLTTRHDGSHRLIEAMPFDANHWSVCPDRAQFSHRATGAGQRR